MITLNSIGFLRTLSAHYAEILYTYEDERGFRHEVVDKFTNDEWYYVDSED